MQPSRPNVAFNSGSRFSVYVCVGMFFFVRPLLTTAQHRRRQRAAADDDGFCAHAHREWNTLELQHVLRALGHLIRTYTYILLVNRRCAVRAKTRRQIARRSPNGVRAARVPTHQQHTRDAPDIKSSMCTHARTRRRALARG